MEMELGEREGRKGKYVGLGRLSQGRNRRERMGERKRTERDREKETERERKRERENIKEVVIIGLKRNLKLKKCPETHKTDCQ